MGSDAGRSSGSFVLSLCPCFTILVEAFVAVWLFLVARTGDACSSR